MLPIVVADRANGLSLFLNNTQHPYTCRNPYVGLQSPLRSRAPFYFSQFSPSVSHFRSQKGRKLGQIQLAGQFTFQQERPIE